MSQKGESSASKLTRRSNRGSAASTDAGFQEGVSARGRLNDVLTRELPHNLDAEEGVIASILLDGTGEVITNCIASKIREEYFYSPVHRKIFAAVLELFNANKPVDEILIADHLAGRNELEAIGGIEQISRIAGRIETYAHYRHWLDVVREKYFLRSLIGVCSETIEGAYTNQDSLDNFIENVEEKVLGISQDRVPDTIKKASEQVEGAVNLINKMIVSKGELSGVPTGFKDLDDMMRGLHPKEMIVVAGRPGTGKTSIALNMAESATLGKGVTYPTLIFSLEMGAEQLYMRMISSRARVDQHKMRQGRIQKQVMGDINKVASEIMTAPIWIDDTADMSILEMRAKARRLQQQLGRDGKKIGLIIVDYLQLLKGIDSRAPREQQVAEMSRGMKAMAKEIDAPVVVLAQLNRETEKENRPPRPSDLRESGSIEQDADVILLLSWMKKSETQDDASGDASSRVVKLEVAKQRNGPTGAVKLLFNRNFTRYENYIDRDDFNQ